MQHDLDLKSLIPPWKMEMWVVLWKVELLVATSRTVEGHNASPRSIENREAIWSLVTVKSKARPTFFGGDAGMAAK